MWTRDDVFGFACNKHEKARPPVEKCIDQVNKKIGKNIISVDDNCPTGSYYRCKLFFELHVKW